MRFAAAALVALRIPKGALEKVQCFWRLPHAFLIKGRQLSLSMLIPTGRSQIGDLDVAPYQLPSEATQPKQTSAT